MKTYDRIVIGAGISGLLAARRATERGESVLVIEREDSIGGVLKPITLGNVTVDAGAEAFSVVGSSALTLFRELGLGEDIVQPARSDARIVLRETMQYRIPHGVMGIPASLDDPELTHIISADALSQARTRDAQPVQFSPGMTVADLVSLRLGEEFVTRLVDPVLTGVHGSSARVLDAQTTLGAVVAAMPSAGSLCAAVAQVRAAQPRPGAAVSSVRGGMHRVPLTLFHSLQTNGCTVLLGVSALSLAREANRWVVNTADESWMATHLTVATGSEVFDRISVSRAFGDSGDDDASSSEHVSVEGDAAAVDVSLVLALVESVQLNEHPLGSGALVAEDSTFTAKATTHVNAKWQWVDDALGSNMHIIRLSFGRSGALPEGDLVTAALADLTSLYGISDLIVRETRVVRWSQALSKPSPSATARMNHTKQLAAEAGIELCGPIVSGNGLLGIISDHYQRNAA